MFTAEVAPPTADFPRMIFVIHEGGYREYFHGNGWHSEESQAVAHVQHMLAKKKKSLLGQLKKLKDFDGAEAVSSAKERR